MLCMCDPLHNADKMAVSTERMNQLMKKKDDMESEIKALNDVLDSQQSVGMDGALVDTEGFPRADIDVYTVRHARHQVICLQNDHQALMDEIEEELYKIHAEARKAKSDNDMDTTQPTTSSTTEAPQLPLGTVASVDEGSPADQSGLKSGDAIIQFGSLTYDNFQGLQNIATIVQHSMNKSIPVSVRREDATVKLSLVPSRWKPNKGPIGCNIVPHVKPKT